MDPSEVRIIASYFIHESLISEVINIDTGHINMTFCIKLKKHKYFQSFILQAVNSKVFTDPKLLIRNYSFLQEYIQNELQISKLPIAKRWKFPVLLVNQLTGEKFATHKSILWRAFEYIESSQVYNVAQTPDMAYQVGYSLAFLHKLLNKVPSSKIKSSVPNIHNTANYLLLYDKLIHSSNFLSTHPGSNDNHELLSLLLKNVSKYRCKSMVLEEGLSKYKLTKSIIHGDPKLSNFIFSLHTNDVISIIDLDTVQHGYLLYDLADCFRSCCNPLGEETNEFNNIIFDTSFYRESLKGYFSCSREILNKKDCYYIPYAIYTITFELALRFLIDFLFENTYFSVDYPSQNLFRSKVQFQLLQSIESEWNSISKIVEDLH